MHIKRSIEAKITMALVGLTILTGCILSNMGGNGAVVADASATTDSGATASVTVADACSLAVSGNNGVAGEDGYTYSTTVNNGSTQVVTANYMMVSCNDYAGFKIYAIGYSGDTLGGTDMVASTSEDYNIKTDGSNAYGSYWKMKLTNANSINTTIPSAYTSFNVIPDDYTLVAQYASNTGNTASTAGMITPSYQIYVGSAQPAGTYTGKVKYTLVHPTSAAAPEKPRPPYMQDITKTELAELMPNIGDEAVLMDSRDTKTYIVAHLGDDNYWMVQNLDHDIVSSEGFYTPSNTDIKNSWTGIVTHATNDTSWMSSSTVPESYDPGDLCWNGIVAEEGDDFIGLEDGTVACDRNGSYYHIGNYYSQAAALATDSFRYSSSANWDQSICPAGWRLPTKDDFAELIGSVGRANLIKAPVYFALSGKYEGGGWPYNVEAYSWFVEGETGRGVQIGIYESNFLGGDLMYGVSIRCVAR